MKAGPWALGCLALLLSVCRASDRPRLLVLTDIGGDPDDTQSLIRLMVYANGLGDPEHPEWGGWGGRYLRASRGLYRDTTDGGTDARNTVSRWQAAFQNEFAARRT